MSHDYKKQSLAMHKKLHGKLEVTPKVPLKNKTDLSLAYTPGVAAVSSLIGKNKKAAREYTIKKNTVAIVSDGSAILGLGNLGAEASLPVMEGKAALLKAFADVDAFPICLDTQDTEEIIKTVQYIAPVFGGINLEDISAPRCFEIERRLQKMLDIPVFHDDQHGTAVVVLAGLINALKLRKLKKQDARVVINGAGAAGIAIANMLLTFGIKHLVLCDSKGIIYTGRKDLNPEKKRIAKKTNTQKLKGTLADAMHGADVFIGVSVANVVTQTMVASMNTQPIVFAMANPDPEIMPDKAKKAGAYIVATGRSDFPNQANNVLAFPGIFRGALDAAVRDITEAMLIRAAEGLAKAVKKPRVDYILPKPFEKGIAQTVAKAMK